MVTIRDVAESAQVSTASVSRVLSGMDGVSKDVEARVREAADQLGYRPNAIARSLRKTGTQTIGLVVSDLMNPFFAELARSVEDAARQSNYNVIIGNADENPAQQDQYIQILLERQVDGLIVVPTEETSPLLHEAAQRLAPLILVDRSARDVDAPVARADSAAAIGSLVQHLAQLGHRRLGTITGPQTADTGRERHLSLTRAVSNLGLELPEQLVYRGDFRAESGEAGMEYLLAQEQRPDVVFCANGQMGQGAIKSLRASGVAWPESIGVCVFDDLPWFDFVDPAITAVSQPITELGGLAVDMLLRRLAGEEVRSMSRPCALRIRASCGELVGDR